MSETTLLPRWAAPHASRPLDARVQIPGSKSLTNRYLVLAALASSPSRLRRPLFSRDTQLMIAALRALGARIEQIPGDGAFGPDLKVWPLVRGQQVVGTRIECGLAGTVMRFVPPVAALLSGQVKFDGDPQARVRPLRPVLEALEDLGVGVLPADAGSLPFTVVGTGEVRGGQVSIDGSQSSQFISALLLVGSQFSEGLLIRHVGSRLPSVDHIRMTLQVLRESGITVSEPAPFQWRIEPGPYPGFDVSVEPDLSNAGPFLAAALAGGGQVQVEGWPKESTQVGARWPEILTQFGAEVSWQAGVLSVRGTGKLNAVSIADSSELAPTIAALAALAPGRSRLSGIAHLRGHETNRLEALVKEITALGGIAEESADGVIIQGGGLHGGLFHSYHDHRMATAGAIIGLAVPGVEVENVETTAKTIPNFPELWSQMIEQHSETDARA